MSATTSNKRAKWQQTILRDICERVDYGYTASATREPIGPKFLRITDIVPELIDWDSVPYCEVGDKNKDKYRLHEGDIVIARTGATTGYAKWIKNQPESVFASYLVRIRIKPEHDNKYVGLVVQSDEYKRFINANLGGAAQPQANAQVLTSFPITLPPLDIQRRIASILSAYDDLIENNTWRIKILEEMARLIYREWFVEFHARGVKLRKATPEEMKVTGKDVFPAGWELKSLGDLAQEVRRSVQPDQVDPETPYFGLEHLPRKSIALSDWGTASEVQSTKLVFRKGEILFGKIRPYFHKVGIAPVDGVCSSDAIVIAPKAAQYFALVLACVSSDEFVNYATQTSQGTKMPRANWNVLVKYPLAVPPPSLLGQFSEWLQDKVDLIVNTIFRNRILRQTRDLLLPKLVSGEIAV